MKDASNSPALVTRLLHAVSGLNPVRAEIFDRLYVRGQSIPEAQMAMGLDPQHFESERSSMLRSFIRAVS
ncbi:MAG: hypothetical protein P3W87_005160 [Gammaproteobacteria bacterium]|nr:hypothetical protein [Gammaproteobacteria bacterium]